MIYNSSPSPVNQPVAVSAYIYTEGNQYLIMKGLPQFISNPAKILDITGRQVWNGNVTSDRINISSANLKKGLYLITLRNKNEMFTQKIVVPWGAAV